MCGIFGMIGRPTANYTSLTINILESLMEASVIRGIDATGFSAVFPGSNEFLVDKRPIPSPKFVKVSNTLRGLYDRPLAPEMFIGHCRATTSGNPKTGRNNHPFNSNLFSLVHNGKIEDWMALAAKNNIKLRTQTDSEILLKAIDSYNNPESALQLIVDESKNAAIATAFMRYAKDRMLFLFRNNERPIAFAMSTTLNAIFFASTPEIFKTALNNASKKLNNSDNAKILNQIIPSDFPSYKLCGYSFMNGYVAETYHRFITRKIIVTTPVSSEIKPPIIPMPLLPSKTVSEAPVAKAVVDNKDDIKIEEILASLTNNKFMTEKELLHWKAWRKNAGS